MISNDYMSNYIEYFNYNYDKDIYEIKLNKGYRFVINNSETLVCANMSTFIALLNKGVYKR